MRSNRLLLIAASGLAREVLSSLRKSEAYSVAGILDEDVGLRGSLLDGVPVLGTMSDVLRYPDAQILVCTASSSARQSVVKHLHSLGVGAERYATVIDPSVAVPDCCRVNRGTIILANVVMTTAVTIGCHVVVMPRVSLAYDDVVDDFALLAAGTTLGGEVHIGRGAYVGMNASVYRGISIGVGASIGLGSAVVEDVPAGERWEGVPAAVKSRRSQGNLPSVNESAAAARSAFERLAQSSLQFVDR